MSKVMLTREQANALKYLKEVEDRSNENIIRKHVRTKYVEGFSWGYDVNSLSELSTDQVVLALVIGYEVEQTPEEKLLELFNKNRNPDFPVYTQGILDTLNVLGIIIPGINGAE